MAQSPPIAYINSSQIVPYGYRFELSKDDLPINAIALCGQAEKNCKTYCSSDPTKRIEIYKEKNPKEYKKHYKDNKLTVILEDKKTNSIVMGICTSIVGGLGSLGWLAGPVGGAPGTTLGILGGIALGGFIVKVLVDEQIDIALQVTDHYIFWLSQSIAEVAYPVFKNFINTDEEYKDYLCPLSSDVCSYPVKAPDGKIYNLKNISEYIEKFTDKNDVKVTSPVYGTIKFSKNELILDHGYCKKIIEISQGTYLKVRQQSKDNKITHGADAVINHTKNIMNAIKDKVGFEVWKKCQNQSPDKISELVAKATAQWDFETFAKIN